MSQLAIKVIGMLPALPYMAHLPYMTYMIFWLSFVSGNCSLVFPNLLSLFW